MPIKQVQTEVNDDSEYDSRKIDLNRLNRTLEKRSGLIENAILENINGTAFKSKLSKHIIT